MWRTVRKFGLKHCDFPTMLWNVACLLRPLFLNVDVRNRNSIPIIFYIIAVISALCYIYVYLVSMVWFVFWKYPETGDVLAALIVFSLGIASEIGPVKLVFMHIYNAKVQRIVTECLACDAQVVTGTRFFKNMMETLRTVKRRVTIFWMVTITNGVLYILQPILAPGRHLSEDLYIIYGLEPMFKTPNYEIAMTLTSFAIWCSCYLPANVSAFFIIVSGYVEAQMLAWSEELLHLWKDAEDLHSKNTRQSLRDTVTFVNSDNISHTNIEVNKLVRQRLKDIMRGHAKNLNILRLIEDVYTGAMAVEFLILVIGLIAELLGGFENTYLEIPFAVMQVSSDCLIGQRLLDASTVFERAVYECKWENFDKHNMKTVLIILVNAQKNMILSAGAIVPLNFMSLMAILRSVFSAYTTLRSTMN